MSAPVLSGLTPERLERLVPGLAPAAARKALSGWLRTGELAPRPGLGAEAIARIRSTVALERLELRERHESPTDGFVRHLLAAPDGVSVEAVRIPLERLGRYTACVSVQAGCAMACVYCATGTLGLARNLAAWEIVEQVRVLRDDLGARHGRAGAARIHGVVVQGMGEAMANLDAVLEALAVISHPAGLAIDAGAITVSTVGLPAGIARLAAEAPAVRLAVSIGSADPAVRRRLFPVAGRTALGELIEAVAEHAERTRRAPMWAVTLLDGINDDLDQAALLAERALAFRARTGHMPTLSIVPFNDISPLDEIGARPEAFRASPPARERAFRERLRSAGVPSRRRMSGGGEVRAACGQLVAGRATQASPLRSRRHP